MADLGWISTVGETDPIEAVELRTDRPQSARMYDYLLGGKTNFAADRDSAELALRAYPGLRTVVRMNRGFMSRAVEYLVGHGIRQFLDIGTGIPTSPNVHETAQRTAPHSRVVYTDNDPIVLAHARALLSGGSGRGRVDYLEADVREPEKILQHPCLAGDDPALDLSRPVALQLISVLHFVPDDADPYGLVRTLMEPLAPGSFLVLSHCTADSNPEQVEGGAEVYRRSGVDFRPRTRAEVARFADGLEIVEPGPATAADWWPAFAGNADIPGGGDPASGDCYLLVARKV